MLDLDRVRFDWWSALVYRRPSASGFQGASNCMISRRKKVVEGKVLNLSTCESNSIRICMMLHAIAA